MLEAERVAVDDGFDEKTVGGQSACNSLLEEIQLTTDIKLSGLHPQRRVVLCGGLFTAYVWHRTDRFTRKGQSAELRGNHVTTVTASFVVHRYNRPH